MLALGKLGGREMTAGSDLDLIVIYDFDATSTDSDGSAAVGRHAIFCAADPAAHQFADRARPTMASSITSTCGCGLRAIPGRWRPSLAAFDIYQREEAWTWEHMALTRARVVSASPGFHRAHRQDDPRGAVPAARAGSRSPPISWRCARPSRPNAAIQTAGTSRMRPEACSISSSSRSICNSFTPQKHPDNPRHEYAARAGKSGCARHSRAGRCGTVFAPAARLYHDLTQILRLCVSGQFDPAKASAGLVAPAGARGGPAGFRDAGAASCRHADGACAPVASASRRQAVGIVSGGYRAAASERSGMRRSSGMRTTTMVPTPTVDRMRIVPPCSSISDFAMARPSPEPW